MAPRYHLRSRAQATVASPTVPTMPGSLADELSRADPSFSNSSTLTTLPPSVPRRATSEVIPGLSYSQAASRTPSPEPFAPGNDNPTSISMDRNRILRSSQSEGTPEVSDVFGNIINTFDGAPRSVKSEEHPWKTVSYKRGRSSSLPAKESDGQGDHSSMTSEQGDTEAVEDLMTENQHTVIKQAEKKLTPSESGRIQRRMDQVREFRATVQDASESESDSDNHKEGTSKDKGKTVDPREWGAANIPETEMDLEAQRRELAMYARERVIEPKVSDRPTPSIKELLAFWKTHHANQDTPDMQASIKLEQETSQNKENSLLMKSRKRRPTKVKIASSESDSGKEGPGKALVDDAIRIKSKPKGKSKGKRHETKERGRKRTNSLAPSSQVEKNSYLGQILGKGSQKRGKQGNSPPSSSSSSSSSRSSADSSGETPPGSSTPSSSYSGSSDSSSNSSSSGDSSSVLNESSDEISDASSIMNRQRRHKNHKGGRSRSRGSRRKNQYRRKQKGTHRRRLPRPKPEKPDPYDGTPDPEKFHKFGRQCKEYLEGYYIKHGEVAIKISHYLSGRAYNFYANSVSDRPHEWSLRRLLKGIFDYCFPLSFRSEQRRKLHNLRQKDKTVLDFAHELQNLFRMVGIVSKREKVDRLWYGLKWQIRNKLLEHGLSPTTSKWQDIIHKANFMEAALGNEGKGPENKSQDNNTATGSNSHQRNRRQPRGNGGGFNKPPNPPKPPPPAGAAGGLHSSRNHQKNSPKGMPQRQKLSDKEKADLKAANKCFVCQGTGHFARNCPENNRVKSNNRNKPPGVSVYSMGLRTAGVEELRSLAQSTATTSAVQLASAEFDWQKLPAMVSESDPDYDDLPELAEVESDSDSDFDEFFENDLDRECQWGYVSDEDTPGLAEVVNNDSNCLPDLLTESESDDEDSEENSKVLRDRAWSMILDERPYLPIGDIISNRATKLLCKYAPYGSRNEKTDYQTGTSFVVYQTGNDKHIIMSAEDDIELLIDSDILGNPGFDFPLWFQHRLQLPEDEPIPRRCADCPWNPCETMGEFFIEAALHLLRKHLGAEKNRFEGERLAGRIDIFDNLLNVGISVPISQMYNPKFDLIRAYTRTLIRSEEAQLPRFSLDDLQGELEWWIPSNDLIVTLNENRTVLPDEGGVDNIAAIELNATYPSYNSLQRTAAVTRDLRRLIPEPIVVVVDVNGEPARALMDSGSLADFISAKFVRQLKVKTFDLEKPLPVQLAVQGSRTKITTGCMIQLKYQDINEGRYLDVSNLENYDIILGTPFLFQHRVSIGFNPTSVLVDSVEPLPIEGKRVRVLESRVADMFDDRVAIARQELRQYADPICKEASDSPLPPLRAINHTIPLIDPTKIYSWRPSRCPDAHLASWAEKKAAYQKSKRWQFTTARNTSPMLLLTKPGTGKNGIPPKLRVVVDLRERNKNTRKLTSPLPDMDGILRRLARKPYRSLVDGKDAYEQIRIEPEHVERTAMTTPDGNMVSLVMQQGDCNAVATYQSLMNHIFAPYLGVFMDVYLDDIMIYSDTLEEHIRHVKLVIDTLRKEQLFLSSGKLHFLENEMKVLGRIVDDQGIRMDPDKVDSVLNWKVPTNKELLRGFLGSVGYLADDIATVRVPMGVLTPLTGSTSSFHWDFTHQRAFDEIKVLVHEHREHRRKPLDYSPDAPPIWLITDGSLGGISGVIAQGRTWDGGRIAAFYSAKLSPAQMNYPVHEVEMLAGVESMLRHRDVLLGCHFTWITDHKGLTHLWKQKNLSGRQARWIEKILEFDFDIQYVPGTENVLADALSRIYSNDRSGTVRAESEYTQYDEGSTLTTHLKHMDISMPVYTSLEASALHPSYTRQVPKSVVPHNMAPGTSNKPTKGVVDSRSRKQLAPAETGRPETSKEFSKRIRRVLLHGPRAEGQEGASPIDKSSTPLRIAKDSPDQPLSTPLQASSTSSRDSKYPVEPLVMTSTSTSKAEAPGKSNHVALVVAEHFPEKENGLLEHIATAEEGINLTSELRNRYSEDKFFKEIIEHPRNHKNFEYRDGILTIKMDGTQLLCIPDIRIRNRSVREIVISHAHSLLAHLGSYKTLRFLRDHIWWKSMGFDVRKFCDTCMTCKRSKPNNQKPYGLLNPLAVPTKPWEAIGIDFVGPLPESGNRDGTFDSITTIIDLLTGMVHLVPSRQNYTAKDVAELVFAEVYKLHGLPRAIVSDRDVLFTSTFWTHLNRLLGIELKMSSAYHPESDGSTERANRTISQMLRQCVNPSQKNWVAKLPAIEFAINSARSSTTGYAPFFLNHGRMPRSFIWNSAGKDEYPGVRAYAQRIKLAVMTAHDSILGARVKQTRDANRRRRPSPFATGDLVYVSTKNMSLPKGLARKLTPKFIGPYRILRDFGNNSYRLTLSSNLKRRGIHDVFHSSLLRIHEPNDDRLFPGRLDTQVFELEDRDGEWTVDRIASHKGKGKNAIFECIWRSGDRTWVPYDTIGHLGVLASYLEVQGIRSIEELGDGLGVPPTSDPQVYIGSLRIPYNIPQNQRKRSKLASHTSHPRTVIDHRQLNTATLNKMSTYFDPLNARRTRHGVFIRPSGSNVQRFYFFHYSQLRAFFFFDQRLRNGKLKDNTPLPGGYSTFVQLYNSDSDGLYKLAAFDPSTSAITITGNPIPNVDEFAPIPVAAKSAQEVREEKAKQGSMLLVVESALRKTDKGRVKKQERISKKRGREEGPGKAEGKRAKVESKKQPTNEKVGTTSESPITPTPTPTAPPAAAAATVTTTAPPAVTITATPTPVVAASTIDQDVTMRSVTSNTTAGPSINCGATAPTSSVFDLRAEFEAVMADGTMQLDEDLLDFEDM
ncbi:hypothetical protein NLI96_g11638 [Meripilus lineatus]|uniref:RNA-directed DNA polymerase n=1 Tax=Meripilus lineatus TaxID=2056292 RepID=A0AAD5YAM8_9APHY|nr:hypothetical protein NLI96_g11638 [Physisporinus lineatus]